MYGNFTLGPVLTQFESRLPFVGTIPDPMREGKTLMHISAISDGGSENSTFVNSYCFSFVYGTNVDFLRDVPALKVLFAERNLEYHGILNVLRKSPNDHKWSAQRGMAIRERLLQMGADVTGLTMNTPLFQMVNRIGQVFSPSWDVRNLIYNFGRVS